MVLLKSHTHAHTARIVSSQPYIQIPGGHTRPSNPIQPKQDLLHSRLHHLVLCHLCGQSKVNKRVLISSRQCSNIMKVETSRLHNHLHDRGHVAICSHLRHSEKSFMARSTRMHVSTSRSKLGSIVCTTTTSDLSLCQRIWYMTTTQSIS